MWLVLEVELHEDDILVSTTERLLRLVLLLAFLLFLCILLDGLVVRQDSIRLFIVYIITFIVLIDTVPSFVLLAIVILIKRSAPVSVVLNKVSAATRVLVVTIPSVVLLVVVVFIK